MGNIAPQITIVMATYEPRADHIERQIDSIKAQTHRDWICLISDDNSAIEAIRLIEKAIGGDSRFRLLRQKNRVGSYLNFERGLGSVSENTPLVALADQDDIWHPAKLKR